MTTPSASERHHLLRRICRAVLLAEAVAAGALAVYQVVAADSSWRWLLAGEMLVLGVLLWVLGRRWPAGTWTPAVLALIQVGVGFSVPTMVLDRSPTSAVGQVIILVFFAFAVTLVVVPRLATR